MRPAIFSLPIQRISLFAITAIIFFTSVGSALAQSPELTLADLLIGLRSKKASLEERNTILTEAISNRGVTFALTPEIEKELAATGAAKQLLDSIRAKMKPTKVASIPTSAPETKPVQPPAPDSLFYEKRATANVTLGNLDLALEDYSKAIEMNPTAYPSYLGRGGVYSTKKQFDLSISDMTKVIENQPKNTSALATRAFAYESTSKLEQAEKDYSQVVALEPENESAKSGVSRVRTELDRIAESLKPKPIPVEVKPQPKPEFVDAGTLTESNASRMVKPVYSQFASRSGITGRVVVEVKLDEEGNVTEAKAISGPQMLRNESELAASRSKFNPVLYGTVPTKAKGIIVYNFVTKR